MALGDPGFYGTNSDDSRNEDYCIYCFAGGEFNEELTMEEMIEQCATRIRTTAGKGDDRTGPAVSGRGCTPTAALRREEGGDTICCPAARHPTTYRYIRMEQTGKRAAHGPEEFYEEVYSIVRQIPPGRVSLTGR